MNQSLWDYVPGQGPLMAAAIHDGHGLREEVAAGIALSDDERLREEDPFTGLWARVAPTRIVGKISRFEMDLNRPREKAVYIVPEDAWGLKVWKEEPAAELIARSVAQYDAFYAEVKKILDGLLNKYDHIVVFDLHTYNHRRSGPNGPLADPEANPEVNIGTGTMNRDIWGPLVDQFISDLHAFDFNGRHLDVRENVKFKGGQFPRWIHGTYPQTVGAIAIEFKKWFMDEWTGQPDQGDLKKIEMALQSTVPGVLDHLARLA